jgi:hypothetical protein
VGASRAMAAGGRLAATTNHDVVEVLVTGLSPFGRGCGGVCVWAWDEPWSALDGFGWHQARARPTIHFWRVGTGNGWRYVIEQAGKEAHGVTSA